MWARTFGLLDELSPQQPVAAATRFPDRTASRPGRGSSPSLKTTPATLGRHHLVMAAVWGYFIDSIRGLMARLVANATKPSLNPHAVFPLYHAHLVNHPRPARAPRRQAVWVTLTSSSAALDFVCSRSDTSRHCRWGCRSVVSVPTRWHPAPGTADLVALHCFLYLVTPQAIPAHQQIPNTRAWGLLCLLVNKERAPC
jgi:hypothetical protein